MTASVKFFLLIAVKEEWCGARKVCYQDQHVSKMYKNTNLNGRKVSRFLSFLNGSNIGSLPNNENIFGSLGQINHETF
jgi:hypothetical protein